MKPILIALLIFLQQLTILAQNKPGEQIDLNFVDKPLVMILESITQQTGYQFSYSTSIVQVDELVTFQKRSDSLEEILKALLETRGLAYTFTGSDRIILKRSNYRQTVRGTIRDIDSHQPIIGANVIVLDSDPLIGAVSDVDGTFKIDQVPVGRRSFLISYVGYEDKVIPNILVNSGKESILNIEMAESLIQMEEVVVLAKRRNHFEPVNELAQVSVRSFSMEETKRFAASVGDPARLALAFPGVTSGDDGTNEIIIRGNSPKGLMWRLEGVEIPSPSHFTSLGASSGGISMFSTQLISTSDFMTGAFPAGYGNALSGVFDINFRKGNDEVREYALQAGLLGVDLAAEGPIVKGGRSSFLINYRYSTLDILDQIGVEVQEENERNIFQDLAFKLHVPTKRFGTFSVFGLGGLSSFTEDEAGFLSDREDYDLGILGLSNTLPLGSDSFLKTVVSTTHSSVVDRIELVIRDETNVIRDTLVENGEFNRSFNRLTTIYNRKLDAKNMLELGATYSLLGYNLHRVDNPVDTLPVDPEYVIFDEEGETNTFEAYANWKWRIAGNLTAVSGLQFYHFSLTDESIFQPRFSLKWQFHPKQSVNFGYGEHSRLDPLENYFANKIMEDGSSVQLNRDLNLTKARHYVLGYDFQINPDLYFKAEAYYQDLYDVPVRRDTEPNTFSAIASSLIFIDGFEPDDFVNSGSGTNYGLELSVEKKFSKGFYYLTNLSLYESKYVAGDGIERDSRFNGNFTFNGVAGKEWKVGKNGKNNIFGVNLKTLFAGNQRFVPIDPAASATQRRTVRDFSNAFEERYPNYFRLDLQLNFIKNRPKATHEWRLDVQNATDRVNVFENFYDFVDNRVRFSEQTALIPVLSYRVQF